MADKITEDRYERMSVNWGVIAVHPTDLEAKYRELYELRQDFVSNSKGGYRTRTTALGHLAEGIDGLLSNGYYPTEVGVIVNALITEKAAAIDEASEVEEVGEDTSIEDEREAAREELTGRIDDAIEELNSLRSQL